MSKKISFKDFVKRAKLLHPHKKYEYYENSFKNMTTLTNICCHKHGIFVQLPYNHVCKNNPHGCPKCKNEKNSEISKLTLNEFISKAKNIHGDKYNYSEVIYEKYDKKIKIICLLHGVFYQTPHTHLIGCGCPKCGKIKTIRAHLLDYNEYIKKAKEVHCDENKKELYSYHLINEDNFISSHKKVPIYCYKLDNKHEEHGIFLQSFNSHIHGKNNNGCPKCKNEKISEILKLTLDEFIYKAKLIHGDRYDYSLVEYKGNKIKVKIICKEHGVFQQQPNSHLNGRGCPKCNLSKGELFIERYLKEHDIKYETQKRFDGCRNKLPLPFDFYLPEYNICIEYQGVQHYIPVKKFGGESRFDDIIKNDKTKEKFCKKNNINLIKISYREFKNINIIAKDILKELSPE